MRRTSKIIREDTQGHRFGSGEFSFGVEPTVNETITRRKTKSRVWWDEYIRILLRQRRDELEWMLLCSKH